VLDGLITGTYDQRMVQFILDTGASMTLIHTKVLERIGSVQDTEIGPIFIETAGGSIQANLYWIESIEVLGKGSGRMIVAGFDLPEKTRIEGLLGLDFVKMFKLVLDIPNGTIEID